MKHSTDTIDNRTSDLPPWNTVPQPTACLQHQMAPEDNSRSL